MLDNENDLESVEKESDQNISEQVSEVDSETEISDEINDQELKTEENEDDESEDNQDNNHETVDWVKKRLAQKDRQVKKRLKEKEQEIEYLRKQVSAIYQPTPQEYSPPPGQIYDPTSGEYVDEDSVEGKVVKKLMQIQETEIAKKQAMEAQVKRTSLGGKIEELKDKYEDFEDVLKGSYQNFTSPMSEMMLNSPNSVETFYNLAKNHPEKLKEISKLPAYQQIKAINFLEFQKETTVHQKLKSDAPKPVAPVKPSTGTFVDKNSYESIFNKQKENLKRKFGE